MTRQWSKRIGWLITAAGLPVFSAAAAEHGSIGADRGSGVWRTSPTELVARAASPGTWTARSTSSHRSRGNGKPSKSSWYGHRRGHGYLRGRSYFVGTGGYSRWERPASEARTGYSTRPSRSPNYGPIVRRDTCSPKVYVIDPESGAIETYCGNVKQQP